MIRNILRITITLAVLAFLPLLGFAQWSEADSVFTWKLIETANLSSQSTLQFIPRQGVTPTSWDFGDSNTSTDVSPTHTYSYSNWDDSITVTLSYTANGENLTHSRRIPLSPAFFLVSPDRNLGKLATYKRVFVSLYRIPNSPDSLGNLRFHWFIDGTALPGNAFDDIALGQWPNIYHTFTSAGVYNVKLEVRNSTSGQTAEFTHSVRIFPDLSSGKDTLRNVPNVFTPNSDGQNDEFIVSSSGTAWFDFRVFTRSGGLVYKTESSIIRWDGKNNQGADMPDGIYYYVIEDLSGQYESAKGFVYLFRGKK